MKTIELTHNKIAIVDDEDFERVSQYHWYANKIKESLWYARRGYRVGAKVKSIRMHQFIMGKAPKGKVIDHINGNGLDNRKENLRIVTQRSNCLNIHTGREYDGVYWEKQCNRWIARIQIKGKHKYLGGFTNREAGRNAYRVERERIERELLAQSF